MTDAIHPRSIRPERSEAHTQQAAHADITENAATAASVTMADPGDGYRNVIQGVAWSYSAAPTGGGLVITDGTTTLFSVAITAAGVDSLIFPGGFTPGASKALVVTLASGAGAVVGKVNLLGPVVETM